MIGCWRWNDEGGDKRWGEMEDRQYRLHGHWLFWVLEMVDWLANYTEEDGLSLERWVVHMNEGEEG